MIAYPPIWGEVKSKFRCDLDSIHGPDHWHRVEDVGLKIARNTGADQDVLRLFAVLHDSCRLDDSNDPEHGRRAAEYATEMRGRLFDLEDQRFELLHSAIAGHVDGYTSKDVTIGTCFDADRLTSG